MPALYPSKFYTIHKLFTGSPFPASGTWGTITDTPVEFAGDALECVIDAFRDDAPTRDDLRVWFFDGVRMHDMTQSFCDAYDQRMEELA